MRNPKSSSQLKSLKNINEKTQKYRATGTKINKQNSSILPKKQTNLLTNIRKHNQILTCLLPQQQIPFNIHSETQNSKFDNKMAIQPINQTKWLSIVPQNQNNLIANSIQNFHKEFSTSVKMKQISPQKFI